MLHNRSASGPSAPPSPTRPPWSADLFQLPSHRLGQVLVDGHQVISRAARLWKASSQELVERFQVFQPPVLPGSHLAQVAPEVDEFAIPLVLAITLYTRSFRDETSVSRWPPWCRSSGLCAEPHAVHSWLAGQISSGSEDGCKSRCYLKIAASPAACRIALTAT